MHILGKILTWLVLIAIVPAIMLSAKLLDAQNNWSDGVDKARQQNDQVAAELPKLEQDLREIRRKVSISSLGVDQFWWPSVNVNNLNVTVNRQNGQLMASIGTNAKLQELIGKDENGQDVSVRTLYAFQMGNALQYVGAFRVETLRENDVTMVPSWQFRPGEADQWANGTNWLFRADIPVSHKTRLDGLLAGVELTVRTIADKQNKLKTQEVLRQDALENLGYRNEQLVGAATPPTEENLPLEFRIGLSPAIEVIEEQRNLEQAELDRLRHLVKQTSDRLNELIDQNDQMVQSLSGQKSERVSSR